MITVAFKPEHVSRIAIQTYQRELINEITPQYATELANNGPCITVMDGEEILACGGAVKMWEGRWQIWALLSPRAGRGMTRIVRAARRLVDLCEGRVEAIVRSDFEQGHRLIKMLGFEPECKHKRFLPGGLDADLYVRL